MITFVELW